MKKSLNESGNSWQLYLSSDLIKLLGITNEECFVSINIQDDVLYVAKTNQRDGLVKKLIKRGAGFGLNFSITLLELLEINPEKDLLDISVNDNVLIIKKYKK